MIVVYILCIHLYVCVTHIIIFTITIIIVIALAFGVLSVCGVELL